MAGKRVRFLTGTDEHGEKIALAAAARGMSPKEHCDSIVQDYKSLWGALDIAYDGFIRTTDAHHEQLVAEVLQRVWDKVRGLAASPGGAPQEQCRRANTPPATKSSCLGSSAGAAHVVEHVPRRCPLILLLQSVAASQNIWPQSSGQH
jgi:hypothetical protein